MASKRKKATAKVVELKPRSRNLRFDGAGRSDGWTNVLTGLGNVAKDKRLGGQMEPERLAYEDAYELYRSHDMAARIVDLPADEMCRKWFDVLVDGEQEVGKDLGKAMEALHAKARFSQAVKWSRAYGGSGILIGADDGQDVMYELNMKKIKTVDFLTVLDVRELRPVEWYADPLHPKYGEVVRYRIMPQWVVPQAVMSAVDLPGIVPDNAKLRKYGTKGAPNGKDPLTGTLPLVHESRILRFEGVLVNRRQRHEMLGWGDSVLNRINEVLRDFGLGWASIGTVLQDFARAVYKMKGLAEIIAANGSATITARIQAIELARSILGATLLDSEDEFTREPTPLSGIPDLLDKFALRLAAAARMPVSLLMGQSPAGLNATGDSDIRWWYDQISSAQGDIILPRAQRLCDIMFACKSGVTSGVVPDTYEVKFCPLWQLSDLEESQRRSNIATADVAYVNAGVLTPEEVATSRFGGDGFSIETQLLEVDPTKRALAAQEQAEAEAALTNPPDDDQGEGTGDGAAPDADGAPGGNDARRQGGDKTNPKGSRT